MKLAISDNALESNLEGKATTFKIAANAKAFRALSSTLYKEQIWSILRELACNAQDAHIQAGHQKQILIKIPNPVNREFYVQDYGPGLSPDGIRDLYTTYFSSSKDQSNDQTGAFGLGSKSPFAYTDQFTVVSAHDGVEVTYLAYLQDGEPSIMEVSRRPVDPEWPSGIRVGFPVKNQDFATFEKEAARLCWMDPVPLIAGVDMVLKTPEKIWSYGPLSLYKNNSYKGFHNRSEGSSGLVMGGIFYPCKLPGIELPYFTAEVAVLEAPIGAVEVALSRESLSFTEYTEKGLKELVDQAVQSLEETIESLFDSYPTYREALEAKSKELSEILKWFKWTKTKQNMSLLAGDPAELPGMENASGMNLFRVKPVGSSNNFLLESAKSQGAQNTLQDTVVFCRVPETKSEAWIRDRIRALVAPVRAKANGEVWVVCLTENTESLRTPTDWDTIGKRWGWPIVDLQKVEISKPKKGDGSKSKATVHGFELPGQVLNRKAVEFARWGWFEKANIIVEGPFHVMLGQFVTKYNETACTSFGGFNRFLALLGEPLADRLILVYSEKAFEKLKANGGIDVNEILLKHSGKKSPEVLPHLPLRIANMARGGFAGLLDAWEVFGKLQEVLEGSELGLFLRWVGSEENKRQTLISHALGYYADALGLSLPEDKVGTELPTKFKLMLEGLAKIRSLDKALSMVSSYAVGPNHVLSENLQCFAEDFLKNYKLPEEVMDLMAKSQ